MKKNTHIASAIIFSLIGTIFIDIILEGNIPNNISYFLNIFFNMPLYVFLIMIGSSIAGGIIPDILDPPFTKGHRRYAHSKALLLLFIIFLFITIILIYLRKQNLVLWIIYYFLIGYISHLFLDSFTPAGLWD